jgi:hypothetical protein
MITPLRIPRRVPKEAKRGEIQLLRHGTGAILQTPCMYQTGEWITDRRKLRDARSQTFLLSELEVEVRRENPLPEGDTASRRDEKANTKGPTEEPTS